MSAAVAATSVEASSSVEPATTAYAAAAVEITPDGSACYRRRLNRGLRPPDRVQRSHRDLQMPAHGRQILDRDRRTQVHGRRSRPTADETTSAVVTATVVSAVVPRTGADKDAAREPFRTVKAVWGASVRVIVVVTVGACRSWADVLARVNPDGDWTNSNTDRNSLRMRERRCDHENTEQTKEL